MRIFLFLLCVTAPLFQAAEYLDETEDSEAIMPRFHYDADDTREGSDSESSIDFAYDPHPPKSEANFARTMRRYKIVDADASDTLTESSEDFASESNDFEIPDVMPALPPLPVVDGDVEATVIAASIPPRQELYAILKRTALVVKFMRETTYDVVEIIRSNRLCVACASDPHNRVVGEDCNVNAGPHIPDELVRKYRWGTLLEALTNLDFIYSAARDQAKLIADATTSADLIQALHGFKLAVEPDFHRKTLIDYVLDYSELTNGIEAYNENTNRWYEMFKNRDALEKSFGHVLSYPDFNNLVEFNQLYLTCVEVRLRELVPNSVFSAVVPVPWQTTMRLDMMLGAFKTETVRKISKLNAPAHTLADVLAALADTQKTTGRLMSEFNSKEHPTRHFYSQYGAGSEDLSANKIATTFSEIVKPMVQSAAAKVSPLLMQLYEEQKKFQLISHVVKEVKSTRKYDEETCFCCGAYGGIRPLSAETRCQERDTFCVRYVNSIIAEYTHHILSAIEAVQTQLNLLEKELYGLNVETGHYAMKKQQYARVRKHILEGKSASEKLLDVIDTMRHRVKAMNNRVGYDGAPVERKLSTRLETDKLYKHIQRLDVQMFRCARKADLYNKFQVKRHVKRRTRNGDTAHYLVSAVGRVAEAIHNFYALEVAAVKSAMVEWNSDVRHHNAPLGPISV